MSLVKPNAMLIAKITGRFSKIEPPAFAKISIFNKSPEPNRKIIAAAGKTYTGNNNALFMLCRLSKIFKQITSFAVLYNEKSLRQSAEGIFLLIVTDAAFQLV